MSQPQLLSSNGYIGVGAAVNNNGLNNNTPAYSAAEAATRGVHNAPAYNHNDQDPSVSVANAFFKDTTFDSAPPQLSFDDITGRPPRRLSQQNLAVGGSAPQLGNFAGIDSERSSVDSSRVSEREQLQPQQPSGAPAQQQRSRPELMHATRSSPGPTGITDFALDGESPFEAARRAQRGQRMGESVESLPQQERKFRLVSFLFVWEICLFLMSVLFRAMFQVLNPEKLCRIISYPYVIETYIPFFILSLS